MSRKHKKICKSLNYIKQFLILASTITGCTSISAFKRGCLVSLYELQILQ